MTMSSTVSKVTLNGDGVQTSWPFAFKVWQEADIEVILSDPTGADSVALDWSAVLAGLGGTVTYPTSGPPLPLGWKITIKRAMPFLQEVDLVSGTRWDPEVVETALDQKTAELQQLKEELSRSVKIGITSSGTAEDLLASIYDARDAAQVSASAAAAQVPLAEDQVALAVAQVVLAEGHADAASQSVLDAELAAASIGILSSEGELAVGQDTIVLPWVYDPILGNVAVYLNGVKQAGDTLTFVDENTVKVGDVVTETTTWEAVSVTMAGESVLTALRDQAEAARDAAQLYKMPIGMVFPFAGTTAPAGSVVLQGQLLSRTGYADLWAHAQTSGNMAASDGAWTIGKFSPGDGSTTFRVPDARDRYIRGASGTRPVGLVEEDAFQGHWHGDGTASGGSVTPSATDGWINSGSSTWSNKKNAIKTYVSDGTNGTPRVADETRVKGIAYLWCIKAFDVISNPAILNAQSVVNQLNDKLDAAEIVAPGDAPKYACRAWVNFDGTTTPPTIRASGNVSSVVRNGTGDFTVNFITPIQDTSYAIGGAVGGSGTGSPESGVSLKGTGAGAPPDNKTTNSVTIRTGYGATPVNYPDTTLFCIR